MSSDMTAFMEDPDFLRKYLLGELAEEKVDAVERRLLADDGYFELVEAIEGELLADCARGSLSPRERERVMLGLASSPRGKTRLSNSRELVILTRERPIPQPKPIPFPLPRKPAVRFAAMAAMLLAVIGGFWLSRHTAIPGGGAAVTFNRTAGALHRLQSPERIAQAPTPPLPAPPAPQPSQTAETPATAAPQPVPQAVPPPADRVAEQHRPPAATRELTPAILELALTTFRSGGALRPTLIVPAGTRRIEIQLPIQEGDDFPTYRAMILDANDDPIWQGDLVSHPAAGDGSVVAVGLPAAKLPAGTYRLELSGISPDGQLETVGKPLFDVRTP